MSSIAGTGCERIIPEEERKTLEESQCRMLRRHNTQKQAIKNVHYNEKLFFEDCEIDKSVHP